MVETYWNIGRRIVEQEQQGRERANYGDYLIVNLSRHLTDTFGKGFSEANLQNMRLFYITFPQFPTQCVGNLSWTNIRTIMRINNAKERNYYLKEASAEKWSSRVLERNIKSGYYKRLLTTQALSAKKNKKTPLITAKDFIKDPYVLEFLNLPENPIPKETAIESAIISHLQNFLKEECKPRITHAQLSMQSMWMNKFNNGVTQGERNKDERCTRDLSRVERLSTNREGHRITRMNANGWFVW